MKDKNYIFISFLFILCISLIFGILTFVKTDYSYLSFQLKPIDMFSDIRPDETDSEPAQADKIPVIELDTCPKGEICIQNFTDQQYPLDALFDKLSAENSTNRKVRIAWYGDSFTDADLLVCNLRDTLQSVFGGNGVGFVPITHEAAGYRRSVLHTFGGWRTSSVIARKGNVDFGINGFLYKPDSGNYVKYTASKRYVHTRKFDLFRLFYTAENAFGARVTLNDTIKEQLTLPASTTPKMLVMDQKNSRKVKVNITQTDNVHIFGASLEDNTGIYIDNFSIKGNSGIGLLAIPARNLEVFDSLLNYDLIVLQFGLNAVSPGMKKYTGYIQNMTKLVAKFRKAFKNKPILILSVSDKSERQNGQFVTMKAVKNLVMAQEKFAYDEKLLFWNLYEAMGGENSMPYYVKSNLASKDYTHLSFDGGRIIGHKLARTIINERRKFEERRKRFVAN